MYLKKRSWGWYWTLWSAKYFKVKFLLFKRGHYCSMQRHKDRSELWLVIFGNGDMEGDFFNPQFNKGDWHSVAPQSLHRFCAHKLSLILEIQYGVSCREDDIERV